MSETVERISRVVKVHDALEGRGVSIEYVSWDGEVNFCHMMKAYWQNLRAQHATDVDALRAYSQLVKQQS